MTQTFSCSACGAPNQAAPGEIRIPCSYCGANLTIPEELRTKRSIPQVEFNPLKAAPIQRPHSEAQANPFKKAEPFLIKAWNTYAAWTWFRWLFPTCLTLFILGCVALGMIPLIFGLTR